MYFDMDAPIRVSAFGKVTQPCGNGHNGRTLPYYLLIYCIGGVVTIITGDNEYELMPGDIFILPAKTFYKSHFSDKCTYYFMHFNAKEASNNEKTLTVSKGAILPEGSYHYVYDNENGSVIEIANHTKNANGKKIDLIFSGISNLEPNFNSSHKFLIDNLLRELLILISSDILDSKKINRHLVKITEYIKVSYSDSISLSSLSKRFKLSETYIARLFKQELGTKPSDYVNRIRVNHAMDLLIHTDMSIGEISDVIGYSSLYYFSRVFKKNTGVSPKDFRNCKV